MTLVATSAGEESEGFRVGGGPPSGRTVASDRLSAANFSRLAQLIERYAGIRMPASKKTMVEGRLRRRVKACGAGSLDRYCAMVLSGEDVEDELVALIDAVTTNKTDFFREPDHFHLLTERVLPSVMAWPDLPGRGRPVEVWSAAASIGAEPYSLAMALDDFGLTVPGFRYRVLATDICTDALAAAKLAIYPAAMADAVPPLLRQRYLRRSRDPEHATVRVVPRLRQAVRFGRLNLMDERYGIGEIDIVFCRNILIYFEKDVQERVLRRICRHLRPGGFLFVGHSETAVGLDLPLHQIAPALYMREAAP
jgi:chemotaxis protein methyltransferase CheR